MLKREKIIHSVLNAKYHQQEAEIVARAGQRGAVTIATNMAGRGTDIKLGPGVAELGGLHVIGTERHEARRIDRQLRGRCARQGDPGSSHFFISLRGRSDAHVRLGRPHRQRSWSGSASKKARNWSIRCSTARSRQAQKRVEQHNYQIRKRTLEYDDVMNKQREVIYGFRNEIIDTEDPRKLVYEVIDEAVPAKVAEYLGTGASSEEPNYAGLLHWINTTFPLGLTKEKAQFETR